MTALKNNASPDPADGDELKNRLQSNPSWKAIVALFFKALKGRAGTIVPVAEQMPLAQNLRTGREGVILLEQIKSVCWH